MRLIDADLLMQQICREECEKDGCDFPCLDKERIEAVPTAAVKSDTVMINWTPDLEKLGRDLGFRALNEFSFMGKSIREWVEIILEQAASKTQPEEGCERMTEKQIMNTLDEMEEYFIRCFAAAANGSRQEARFARYLRAIREVKELIKPRETAENKEANP